ATPAAQRGPCAVLLTAPIQGFGRASVRTRMALKRLMRNRMEWSGRVLEGSSRTVRSKMTLEGRMGNRMERFARSGTGEGADERSKMFRETSGPAVASGSCFRLDRDVGNGPSERGSRRA